MGCWCWRRRYVEYLDVAGYRPKVAEIDDKMETMHQRILNARKQHEFFRRLSANTELGLRQLFIAGILDLT